MQDAKTQVHLSIPIQNYLSLQPCTTQAFLTWAIIPFQVTNATIITHLKGQKEKKIENTTMIVNGNTIFSLILTILHG